MMRDAPHSPLHLAGFVCESITGPGPSLQLLAVSTNELTTRDRGRRGFSLLISTRPLLFFSHFWTLPLNHLALSERKVSQPRLVVHVLYRHSIPNGVETPMMIKTRDHLRKNAPKLLLIIVANSTRGCFNA